jgi:hypothetical protein
MTSTAILPFGKELTFLVQLDTPKNWRNLLKRSLSCGPAGVTSLLRYDKPRRVFYLLTRHDLLYFGDRAGTSLPMTGKKWALPSIQRKQPRQHSDEAGILRRWVLP